MQDASVLVTQTGNHIQSRGFGFVTFKDEKSVLAAVQAHYVTIMDKEVEIKSVLPKWLLVNVSEKQSTQQDGQEKNEKRQPAQLSHKKIVEVEEDLPQYSSWVNQSLSCQVTTSSTGAQAQSHTASEKQIIPTWLRIFKKWLPSFIQNLSKHPREGEYALSSLKKDFRDKFGLDLDHASIGYPKLSDFMKCFSDLCSVQVLPIGRRGIANHMVLLPKYPRPQQHLLHMPKTPQTPSSADSNSDGSDLTSSSSENVGLGFSHFEKDDDSTVFSDLNSPRWATSPTVQPSFLQFLKQDSIFHIRPWLQKEHNADKGSNANDEIGQCLEAAQGNNLSRPQRNLVLEAFSRRRNHQSVYFLREFDFYKVSGTLSITCCC